MEAGAGGVTLREWLNDRFHNFDVRIQSNHDAIAEARKNSGKRQEKIIKIEATLEDLSGDMSEMKKTMTWIVRGLFGAIAVGMMFVVAVATLILQAAH